VLGVFGFVWSVMLDCKENAGVKIEGF
jgi:hypothetical protein